MSCRWIYSYETVYRFGAFGSSSDALSDARYRGTRLDVEGLPLRCFEPSEVNPYATLMPSTLVRSLKLYVPYFFLCPDVEIASRIFILVFHQRNVEVKPASGSLLLFLSITLSWLFELQCRLERVS